MLPKEAEVGVPEALADLILALQAAVLAAEVADLMHVMILAMLALIDIEWVKVTASTRAIVLYGKLVHMEHACLATQPR